MKQVFALLALLSALSFAHRAHAVTLSNLNDTEFQLNRASPEAMQRNRLGTLVTKRTVKYLKCTYTFGTQGGSSAAAIKLKDDQGQDCKLPNKSILRDVLLDFKTAATSGGSATLSLGTGQGASTTDLKNALAVASATGLVAGVPVGSAATAIKLTADRTISLTIGTAALTAGVMNALLQYELSE